jgi:alpha-ketoglutarate-dependent taurine dioxygenase
MKISPINKLGSFGAYVDDINMDHMTEDEWREIGKLFVKELVVVLRDIKITKPQYVDWIQKFGPFKSDHTPEFVKKYGKNPDATRPNTWGNLTVDDQKWLQYRQHVLEETGDGRYLTRVYGRTTEDGKPLGYFSSGEVYWHSNECSSLTFSPCVSLLGWEHMGGSTTGFLQTVDLYESLPSSFQKELDDMVIIHRFAPGRINDRELEDPNLSEDMRRLFCPVDGAETPMVCTAPNGRKGLHYSLNTRAEIRGMSLKDSHQLFEKLDKLLLDDKWIFDHAYNEQHDICLFDNSVTMHRRLGGHLDRKAFRLQFDPSPLLDQPWAPWQHHSESHARYVKKANEAADILGGNYKQRIKIPV